MTKQPVNPFIISGYEGAEYFCDREAETHRLCNEIVNGNNVALIATRRIGKSGLIHHCFGQDDLNCYLTFFIDIYDTCSLSELVFRMSQEIVRRLKPRGLKMLHSFWDAVHSLQAGITISPMGEPSFNVQVGDIHHPETTLDEIFDYLERAESPCIVAIDEFQQISQYPEKNIEATLRTYIQRCHNARFIFAGSQRHVMSEMFTSAARPFFQSVSVMHLDVIDIDKYDAFARYHFEAAGKHLASGVTEVVYSYSRGITWYSQKLYNTLFSQTAVGETCTPDDVHSALNYILDTLEYSFKETLFRIPEKQKALLVALAKSGPSKSITSSNFIHSNRLSSSSSVQSAIRGLLDKDFVTMEQGIYSIYNLFLEYWIKRCY